MFTGVSGNSSASGVIGGVPSGLVKDRPFGGSDITGEDAGISLFKKDLMDLLASQVKASKPSDAAVAENAESSGDIDLQGLLAGLNSLLDNLPEGDTLAATAGNGLPLNGSELPAIAAELKQALEQLLAEVQQVLTGHGEQNPTALATGELNSNSLFTALNTAVNHVASITENLFAKLSSTAGGFANQSVNAESLTAINASLDRLRAGAASGELSQGIAKALGQVINGLKAAGDLFSGVNIATAAAATNLTTAELNANALSHPALANYSAASANTTALAGQLKANAGAVGESALANNPLNASANALTSSNAPSFDIRQLLGDAAVKELGGNEANLLALNGELRSATSQTRGSQAQAAAANGQGLNAQSFNTQLELPLGNAQWGNQVLQRVAWLTGHGITSAEIHLNPPELGPMQVRVEQRQDSASVVFTSHHSSTREAIEASLPRLRELFNEQGMDLLDVDVDSGEQQTSESQAGNASSDGDSAETDQERTAGEAAAKPNEQLAGQITETISLHYGLVDAYA